MEIEFTDEDAAPDAAPDAASVAASVAAPVGAVEPELEGLSFLVIDDSGVQRKFITNALVDFGAHNITETKDAVDGLSVLRDPQKHVDIVLVDQEMPILDGTQFTQMVRNDMSLPNPDIPIIMVTSFSNQSRIVEAKKAGIDGFVAKPFTPDNMRSQVKLVLEKRLSHRKPPPPNQHLNHQDLKNLRCLVIDDSEFSRKLICRSLYSIGIKDILQTADAVDGLAILREKFQAIDLILVDREMPIFDGVEFTRMVRRDEALDNTHIPIIMVSGLISPQHILDAKSAGISAFISKPFSTTDIENHMRMVLSQAT